MSKLTTEEKIKLIQTISLTMEYLTKNEALDIANICMDAEDRECRR